MRNELLDNFDELKPGEYETSDFHFAIVLLVDGQELIDVRGNRYNKNRRVFIFQKEERIEQMRILYLRDKLMMSPKKIFEQMRFLKGIIYGQV